eukprot:615236-Hanusia_phi.AAC.1
MSKGTSAALAIFSEKGTGFHCQARQRRGPKRMETAAKARAGGGAGYEREEGEEGEQEGEERRSRK